MEKEYCNFKKSKCPFPASSQEVCLKSDEGKCTMAEILKEKEKSLKIMIQSQFDFQSQI